MVDALERDALQVGLDTELVDSFVVGAGSVLRLSGWCFHPWQRVHDLHVVADGIAHPVYIRGIVTVDIFKANAPDRDHTGNSLNSGFYALVPFSRVDTPRAIDLTLRAILADGSECDAALGRIMVLPYASKAEAITFPDMSDQPEEPRLAICMATYNPPLDLFEQQVDSIHRQSHRNWICIVNATARCPRTMRRCAASSPGAQRFFLFRNAAPGTSTTILKPRWSACRQVRSSSRCATKMIARMPEAASQPSPLRPIDDPCLHRSGTSSPARAR